MVMEIKPISTGKFIKDGKRVYEIYKMNVKTYEKFTEMTSKGVSPYKIMDYVCKNTLFRNIGFWFFKKKVSDFNIYNIPLENFMDFQKDLFDEMFEKDFMKKMKGVM